MRQFGESFVTFTIILSPILIMGRPIVGGVNEDYYSILGLNENSSADEVLQAFYRLQDIYGPDVTNDPIAQMRYQKIVEAFNVLSDVNKRRQYDYQRRVGGNYQSAGSFVYPNGNAFGQQFGDGIGGNAFAWTPGNGAGTNSFGWNGVNGWNAGNGMNGNYAWGTGNTGYAWGGQGGGTYGGGAGGYANTAGSGTYGGGNGGSAWVVQGGDGGATVWAAGGGGGGQGGGRGGGAAVASGGAAAVSSGGTGEATYESYTINGCTTVTKRMGDSYAQYTTCE